MKVVAAFVMSMICAVIGLPPAQASPFDYMEQSLAKVIAMSTIVNIADYDYAYRNSIFGYFLDKGSSGRLRQEFGANKEYMILGAGDDDMLDLDISIENDSGEILVSDTKSDAAPVVEFTPKTTENYTINIKNHDSADVSFCTFVILQKTGSGEFSLEDIAEALDNAMTAARLRAILSNGMPRNRLILFGGRFNPGDAFPITDFSLPAGEYGFIAAGSNSIQDADITVIEQYSHGSQEGITLCSDNQSDNTPMCQFTVKDGNFISLQLKNYASTGSGFLFGVLLQD